MDDTKQGGSSRGNSGRYRLKASGINRRGNHWCSRDYGPSAANGNTYHYKNLDGSFYYYNPDGSKYFNNGKGYADYTNRSGGGWKAIGGKRMTKGSS